MYVRMMPQNISPSPIRAGIVEEYAMAPSRLAVPRMSKIRLIVLERVTVIFAMFCSSVVLAFLAFSIAWFMPSKLRLVRLCCCSTWFSRFRFSGVLLVSAQVAVL